MALSVTETCRRIIRRRSDGKARWLALPFLIVLSSQGAAAQAFPDPEHQIEAVFMYHFAQFVTWPSAALGGAETPMIIGVLGEDPFGAYLDEVVRGETVNGRPLDVRRYPRVEDIDLCHILFVGRDEARRMEHLLPYLQGRPILTVSDADDFTADGGMIQFVKRQSKIRFRINVRASQAAGLAISSKLLQLAEIVATTGG